MTGRGDVFTSTKIESQSRQKSHLHSTHERYTNLTRTTSEHPTNFRTHLGTWARQNDIDVGLVEQLLWVSPGFCFFMFSSAGRIPIGDYKIWNKTRMVTRTAHYATRGYLNVCICGTNRDHIDCNGRNEALFLLGELCEHRQLQ